MPLERKKRTEAFLRECGIPVYEELPVIISEKEIAPKSATAVLKRAVCAFLASQIAIDIIEGKKSGKKSASILYRYVEGYGLEENLTPDEQLIFELRKGFFTKKVPREKIRELEWRVERTMPLFWACGLYGDDLDYPSGTSVDRIHQMVQLIAPCDSFSKLVSAAQLQPYSELLENADQNYRMDYACRVAAKNGEEPPADLFPKVLDEQRKAFDWLLKETEEKVWDELK